jgi:hypothetical protein
LFPLLYYGGSGSVTSTYPQSFPLGTITGVPPAIFADVEGVFVWSVPLGGGLDSVYVVLRAKSTAMVEIGGDLRMSAPGVGNWRADNFDLPPPFTTADWSNRLFRNNGNGTFTEMTSFAFNVNDPGYNSGSACWGDYDNDGHIDVFVANSGTVKVRDQPDYLYRNNGNGTFSEVAAIEGVQGPSEGMSDGGSWVDLNSDGFLDLFVNHGAEHPPFGIGPRRLWMNAPNGNHWMMLELQGIQSNGSGIGARVRFAGPSGVNWRTVLGDTDNGFAGFTGVHVGLGQDASCDSVQIFWPSGVIDTFHDVAADAKYFAIEGQPLRALQDPLLELGFTAYADTISETAFFAVPLPVSNPGGAALHYTTTSVSCSGQPVSWLTLDFPSGDVWPGSTPELEVRIHPESLPYGSHCGRIVFTTNAADEPDTLEVELLVFNPSVSAPDVAGALAFALGPPRPNPFTGESRITLSIPAAGPVNVVVYDVAGHRVRRLVDAPLEGGMHDLEWDGRDERGRRVSAGAYFVRAAAGSEVRSRKLILLD